MNECQKMAERNIRAIARETVFGLCECCVTVYTECDEKRESLSILKNIDKLVDLVIKEATSTLYPGRDACCFGVKASGTRACIEDIRSCGKQFLMQTARAYCGYYQGLVVNGAETYVEAFTQFRKQRERNHGDIGDRSNGT